MYEEQTDPLIVLTDGTEKRLHVWSANSSHMSKWRLWCCRPWQAAIEVKTCMGRCRPMYHWRPPVTEESLGSHVKTQHQHKWRRGLSISTNDEEETGKSQMGWGRRFTDICYNRSKLFTWNCRSRCQVVSSQFWVFEGTHTTLLLKRGFPHSKNKHKPVAVSDATDDLHTPRPK